MQCPHCRKSIHFEETDSDVYEYTEPLASGATGFEVTHGFCPACEELIVLFRDGYYYRLPTGEDQLTEVLGEHVLYPVDHKVRALGAEVPDPYRFDFDEAVAVLPYSAKASAAIMRRLLQQILREDFSIEASNLAKEIEVFIGLPDVPSYLSDAVDAVRNIGNLAAHPMKNSQTGEIADVEPGEAEWLLEVVESLCDFRFVQPKRIERRRGDLNKKLEQLGKPPLKGGSALAD